MFLNLRQLAVLSQTVQLTLLSQRGEIMEEPKHYQTRLLTEA